MRWSAIPALSRCRPSRTRTSRRPGCDDVYQIGVAAAIHTMLRLPEHQRLIIQGLRRIRIKECVQTAALPACEDRGSAGCRRLDGEELVEIEALRRNVADNFQKVVALSPNLPDELQSIATAITKPGVLADTVALHLPIAIAEKQALLETAGHKGAPARAAGDTDARGGSPRTRQQDPVAGAFRDGQDSEGVLPARADEGDPARAGRGRRAHRRGRGASREDRRGPDDRGGREGSPARARPAQPNVARRA